jgi:ABC-type transporter Mla maintaining outer membrane lipid asymmetry permease subunit MlaE
MKVSEQIDALTRSAATRGRARRAAHPRGPDRDADAGGLANFVGVFAGIVAARFAVGLGPESFLFGARMFWHSWDLLYSIAKGVVFGLVIPLISVHMGFGRAAAPRASAAPPRVPS